MQVVEEILKSLYKRKGDGEYHRLAKFKNLESHPLYLLKSTIIELRTKNYIEVLDIANSLQNEINSFNELIFQLKITPEGIEYYKSVLDKKPISVWGKDLKKWLWSGAGVVALAALLTTAYNVFWKKSKSPETTMYPVRCEIPAFQKSVNKEFHVLVANFSQAESDQVGGLIEKRYKSIVGAANTDIKIKYCKDLYPITDELLSKILTENNVNLLIYGDYYEKEKFGDSAAIIYNYALLKKEAGNSMPLRKDGDSIINIAGLKDVIKGKGQQDYDYIIYYYLGMKNLYRDEINVAIDNLGKAKFAKKTVDIFIELAFAYSVFYQDAKALDVIEEGLKIFPDSAVLYVTKVSAKNALHDYAAAIIAGNKALQLDGVQNSLGAAKYSLYLNLVEAYHNTEQEKPALYYSQQMIFCRPTSDEAYLLAGKVALDFGKLPLFTMFYRYGLDRNPGSKTLHEGYALFNYSFYKLSGEKSFLDSALRYDPDAAAKFATNIRSKYFATRFIAKTDEYKNSDSLHQAYREFMKKPMTDSMRKAMLKYLQ